jgi:hypothetical protein
MEHRKLPPPDQVILDNYFKLSQRKDTSSIAWLYGMAATYGINPRLLKGFKWNRDNTITVTTKKRTLKPFHPQWLFLFQLKEKQPPNIESCFEKISCELTALMQNQELSLKDANLQAAYRARKIMYSVQKKLQKIQSPSSEALCVQK